MQRILFVSNLFPRPDATQRGVFNAAFVAALHARLAAGGGRVDVVVPVAEWKVRRWAGIRAWAFPGAGWPAGCRVRYVPCFHLPVIGRSFAWRFYREALRVACAPVLCSCDAVLGSWLYPEAVAVQRLAEGVGKPCWIRLHGTDRFHLDRAFRGAVCRRALCAASGVWVNAHFMRDELVRRGIPVERIAIIPNGVDRAIFAPGPAGRRNRRAVLWVGNLTGIKRPDLAIRVIRALPGGPGALSLTLVGTGPQRQHLERLAWRLGVGGRVAFAGEIGRQEMAERLCTAAVLLLTSRSEGMPNVVIEALACGTPVVSTAVGDVPRLIVDGVNGMTVSGSGQADTVSRLSAALMQVLAADLDPALVSATVSARDWDRTAMTAQAMMNAGEAG